MFLDVVGCTWMMFPPEVERASITRRDFYYVLPAKVLKLGMSSVNNPSDMGLSQNRLSEHHHFPY